MGDLSVGSRQSQTRDPGTGRADRPRLRPALRLHDAGCSFESVASGV